MKKLIDYINESLLLEKHTDYLYHFCSSTIESFFKMMREKSFRLQEREKSMNYRFFTNNSIKDEKIEDRLRNKYKFCMSFTRESALGKGYNELLKNYGWVARFNFDGVQLASKYKISPFNFFGMPEISSYSFGEFDKAQKIDYVDIKSKSEYEFKNQTEDRLFTSKSRLDFDELNTNKKSIISLDILIQDDDDYTIEFIKEMKNFLDVNGKFPFEIRLFDNYRDFNKGVYAKNYTIINNSTDWENAINKIEWIDYKQCI